MLQVDMTTVDSFSHLTDDQLTARVQTLAGDERRATAALIASLVEFDARRLFLREGCSSLFTYCTQVLHLSEHATYGRIEAARAARRFPVLLDLLADGALTLTAICLLAPHLTAENCEDALAAARHKTKRHVELLVATLRPKPAVPTVVRKLPQAKLATPLPERSDGRNVLVSCDGADMHLESRSAAPVERPDRPSVVVPLAPERYKLQITLSAETYAKLQRAQDLLRYAIPNGDAAAIVERALTLLVRELERTKYAETDRPQPPRSVRQRSRHVPADVRRRVWKRDGGQCAFVGTQGRCIERGFLEFHHVEPYARGGAATAENIELRCRAHNAYESEREFGPLFAREDRAQFMNSVLDRVDCRLRRRGGEPKTNRVELDSRVF